jgi:hypothetical protein
MHNLLDFNYIRQGGVRFDFLKFLLALIIVTLHAGLVPKPLIPIARLAVPLFFMMSSYFYHLKFSTAKDAQEKKALFMKYIRRNLCLYFFWSLLLLPFIVLLHRSWFNEGFYHALLSILKSFFITGFFPASWFILASVFSVVIVFILSKRMNNGWLIIISLILYCLALFDSNYVGLLGAKARSVFSIPGISYYKSFPAALIWVVIGKIVAENNRMIPDRVLYPSLFVSIILYYFEFLTIEHFEWSLHSDCFITSIPLVTLIFVMIGQMRDMRCRCALWLRKSSIIIYCLHFIVIRYIINVYEHLHLEPHMLLVFSLTVIICISSAFLIIYCCEEKGIKVLRYAY